jgi:zinc transport system substrate-binding protein
MKSRLKAGESKTKVRERFFLFLPKTLLAISLSVSFLIGCNSSADKSTHQEKNTPAQLTRERLDITVSILPQKYFVEKIGGLQQSRSRRDRLSVNVMVQPGAQPATYEPKPQQLKALSQAEAYISIGVPFEKAWMDKIKAANPQMLIIDSTKNIQKREMSAHYHHGEEKHHEPHSDHEATLDPHIWLSPQLVKVQAENIYQGLVQLDPTQKEEYKKNLEQFKAEIDQLDQTIKQNLAGIKNRKFIVFHPAWGYFARDYNLEQVPIEVGGQEPSAAELAQLIQEAKEEDIKVVFAQPEFSTKSATTIAQEIGGEVLLITPLTLDWSDNLLKISQTFAEVLQKPKS